MHRLRRKIFVFFTIFFLFVVVALFSGCRGSQPPTGSQPPKETTGTTKTSVITPTTLQALQLVGKPAWNFTADTIDGNSVTLSSFVGKPVLVNFWATWCPPCRGEMPIIQQIQDEYTSQGLKILEVNDAENLQKVSNFILQNGYTFEVLMDTDGSIGQQYGVIYLPTSIFIDKSGIVRDVVIGAFPSKSELERHLDVIMR